MGHHRSASATRLLGLDGFEVLAGGQWRLGVQTTATAVDFRAEGRGPSSTAGARCGARPAQWVAVR